MAAVFVYSDGYYADLGDHVFPIEKYRCVRRELAARKVFERHVLVEPQPAARDELLLVHTSEYVDDLLQARLTSRTVAAEMPLTGEIVQAFLLAAGGTIRACSEALKEGFAVNLGGGFHHAFPDHAEGFCYVNDMAVAVRRLQRERNEIKTAIIDCDLHQGNGTAFIFRDDENVFTFSIHQRDLYPKKEDSNWDIHLPKGIGDEPYLTHLQGAVPAILDKFQPDLVLYQAGADPYEGDQLGELRLTLKGLQKRDDLIFGECRKRGVPVATVLGGGYALDPTDTVTIHVNTCLAAVECSTQ